MKWNEFNRKIRIKAKSEEVYKAWCQPKQLSTWFLESCIIQGDNQNSLSVQKNDRLEWIWHNYPNPMIVEIIDLVENEMLEFSFGNSMKVRVELIKENEYTILHLRQYNIPTDDESKMNFHVGCRQAWSTWMLNLKCWIEHDICLHDKELDKREDLFDFVNT